MELNGKVAIVTGSSRGLGKAIAKTFARAGASVTLAARTEEPHPRIGGTIIQTAKEIKEEGGTSLPVKCNVAIDDDIESMVQKTLDVFGHIDVLIHPAAANFPGSIEATDLRRWDILMSLNFRGLAALAKAVLPSMKTAGEGHIVNVSPKLRLDTGTSGVQSGYFGGPYGLSKQASTLLALTMAEEFKDYGIAVNTIWPDGSRLRTEGMIAMGRVDPSAQDPQRFADAVAEIISKDPRSYTGHSLSDIEILHDAGITDLSKYDLPPLEETS
jgi:citronellol/citronellal dehydrogenase